MTHFYHSLSAEVYDLDKPIGHSFGDVEYYIERLASCTGPILEPAVGTGRILIPLLEQGFHVEGVDSSPEMLAICEKHCKNRGLSPALMKANMESFTSSTKYEAIIVPTGSFLLLHKRDASIQALNNFYQHLIDGGRVIIDLFLQTDLVLEQPTTKTWRTNQGDLITYESKTIKVDYLHQYTISLGRYEKWKNGALIQTELEQFPLRWYGIDEFKLILKEVGFQNIVISSDYQYGKEPTNANQTITFEATK
ncbi:methyltransferase [Halalkalibacter wakoensis JCM 9140]|uniref:Methyltransferase n=1 Tax=Halalkalibacter wakoensis JCM 9140 TaxID=1236970 RepID=W4PZM1_9BACI|nr:class I SAM-dependent methyltransferase [Halalkalibacter wakoensis]GAE25187.1 methyltransferase [Halalkalibacter wakoensis JCM 9140]